MSVEGELSGERIGDKEDKVRYKYTPIYVYAIERGTLKPATHA
jgi:hypothetical protein